MIMTSQEFNQNTSLAQRYAQTAPVIITHRGKPAYVLIKYDDYQPSQPSKNALQTLLDLSHPADVGDVELPLQPRSQAQRQPMDFGDV